MRWPSLPTLRRAEYAEHCVFVVLLLVGVWLRSTRYFHDPIALWLDEAQWGTRLMQVSLWEQAIRPLGFLWLSRTLVEWFGGFEPVLRFPAYAAGVLVLPLSYCCARLCFSHGLARLLCVAVFALHPLLIDFSKEFKPYSGEVFVHLLLVTVTLAALAKPISKRRAWLALSTALLALPFAYNSVFAYPALFGVLAYSSYRQNDRIGVLRVCITALAALALLAGLQFGVLARVDSTSYGAEYWGRKYDVFLLADRSWNEGGQPASAARWVFDKYLSLVQGPGFVPSGWESGAEPSTPQPLHALQTGAWTLAFALGLGTLALRRPQQLLLLVTPLLLIGAFNALGKWPLGFFRVNLFALVYVTLLALAAIDWLLDWGASWCERLGARGVQGWPRRAVVAAPAALLALSLMLPRVSFAAPNPNVKETRPWMAHSELRQAARKLRDHASERRAALLVDHYSYHGLEYYARVHPERSKLSLRKRFAVKRSEDLQHLQRAVLKQRGEFWVLVSRLEFVAPMRQLVGRECEQVKELELGPHHLLALCRR